MRIWEPITITVGERSFAGYRAADAAARRRGLLDTDPLPPDMALLLEPAYSIHMIGMRSSIDVLFADRRGRIRKLIENASPGFHLHNCWRGYSCLEMAPGMIAEHGLRAGERVVFEPQRG